MHALITKTNAQSVTTKQHHTKELAQQTQMTFCYSFNCTLLPKICNVHHVSHWQLTRRALNIKKTWDWLFDCLYILSKLVKIQIINVLVKIFPHAHALSPPDLLDPTGATYDDACHVSFEVTVPSTLIVTNWAVSSWKVVHQCELVNTHWWTTFQLLSLWLSISAGLWPQTTHASS